MSAARPLPTPASHLRLVADGSAAPPVRPVPTVAEALDAFPADERDAVLRLARRMVRVTLHR